MDAKLVEREGKSLAELGPERLEQEGDMLEFEGLMLDNDAFDRALAAGQIDDDGSCRSAAPTTVAASLIVYGPLPVDASGSGNASSTFAPIRNP